MGKIRVFQFIQNVQHLKRTKSIFDLAHKIPALSVFYQFIAKSMMYREKGISRV